MARKTPTKKYKYQINKEKYDRQVQRIKKNYEDIEKMGGKFSKTLTEIIKPAQKPTEATVRRLKQISKNDLYKLAKTPTGEPGWKLRIEREKRSAEKARITRWETQLAKQYFGADQWYNYTEKEKRSAREEARKIRAEELEDWRRQVEQEAESYQEPEEPYQWIPPEQEPEPVKAEEADIPETDYPEDSEPPYAGEDTEEHDDFSNDVGDSSHYRSSMIDLIRNEIRANDDYELIRDLGDKFEDMVNSMTDTELNKWVEDYGHDFLDNVKQVIKYKSGKDIVAKKYYDNAVSMLHGGITPLDEFYKDDNYYDKDEAQLYKGTWYDVSTGEILDNGRRFKDHTLYRNIDNNAEYKDGQLMWGNVPLDKLPKGIRQRDLSIMGYSPSEIEEILDEEYGD